MGGIAEKRGTRLRNGRGGKVRQKMKGIRRGAEHRRSRARRGGEAAGGQRKGERQGADMG